MTTLTRRQREILDFIVEAIEVDGSPPTMREIGARFGLASTYTVTCHLRALQKKGAITFGGFTSRCIRIPGVRWVMTPIADGKAAE